MEDNSSQQDQPVAIQIRGLSKTYKTGFLVHAQAESRLKVVGAGCL